MSVTSVVGVMLALGYIAVALVGVIAWRRRMRESLPLGERVPVDDKRPGRERLPGDHWRQAA